MSYIDLHCDTLLNYFNDETFDLYRSETSSIDLLRLHQAGVMAQFFAICLPSVATLQRRGFTVEQFLQFSIERFEEALAAHGDIVEHAVTASDVETCRDEGRLAALLSIEDGRAVAGDLARLGEYRALGVRMLTLTWFEHNCFGAPSSDDATVMAEGLTPFGLQAVPLMNELGIIIDVSHLSDGGFWDSDVRTFNVSVYHRRTGETRVFTVVSKRLEKASFLDTPLIVSLFLVFDETLKTL